MKTQIYVNPPVMERKRSDACFKALGYELESKFSNDHASCVIPGENLYAMLLVESFFKTFTNKPICDATKSTGVRVCLSCNSRAGI